MQKPILNLSEAARELGVTTKTVQRWLRQGKLPFVQMGKVRRIPRGALEQWLRQKEQEALEAVKR